MTEVSITEKPVHSFGEQINGLVSYDRELRQEKVKPYSLASL